MLFRPRLRPGYSTQTHHLPTCQRTITLKTHTHTKNTSVYPQQWSCLCGCEAPPQWEEAEEMSSAVCSLLITSKKPSDKLAAQTATTKTSRSKSHTFYCKLLLNYFSEPHPRGKRDVKISFQLSEGTRNQSRYTVKGCDAHYTKFKITF